jgi:ketosteroid isomerase-like protein
MPHQQTNRASSGFRIRGSITWIPVLLCLIALKTSVFSQAVPQQVNSADATTAKSQPMTVQQRKEQLASDTAKLLDLAHELKVEVDKSTRDMLSVAVVRKANEVEKQARKVRDEMKMIPAN